VKISLDALGGDFAPHVTTAGALEFVREIPDVEVILTGPQKQIETLLGKGHTRISVVDAPEMIDMAEKASAQIRNKKNTSMYRCVDLVVKGEAQACVSAGSSGAFMALSLLLLKRLLDIERPALVTPFPTLKEPCYCLDMGANVDCKPEHLVHFALMGHAYAQVIKNVQRPRIGLISNGEEEGKGNELCRETHALLKQVPQINYAGYCEGRDIFSGEFDVVVCDGFVGNVILKTSEGLAEAIISLLKQGFSSSLMGKLGYLMAKGALRPLKKKLDYAEYGAAPLLGVGGVSMICHGRSSSLAIKNALKSASHYCRQGLMEKLKAALELNNSARTSSSAVSGSDPTAPPQKGLG
jgi:phosphate acyltransferase